MKYPFYFKFTNTNNDQYSDLIVVNDGREIISYLGQGGNQFDLTQKIMYTEYSFLPFDIKINDYNEDNAMDVACILYTVGTADSIVIHLGDGNGGFLHPISFSVDHTSDFDVGDLNEDNHLDFVVARPSKTGFESVAKVFYGKGDGTVDSAVEYNWGNNETKIKITDVNADNHLDILIENGSYGEITYINGDGTGNFSQMGVLNHPRITISMASADMNGDDIPDVLTSSLSGISVFLGNEMGFIDQANTLAASSLPVMVKSADINGDSYADIATICQDSNLCRIYFNQNGQNFDTSIRLETKSKPTDLLLKDFNNDSNIDIAIANNKSNSVSIYISEGNGNFKSPIEYNAGDYPEKIVMEAKPYDIATADFNEDGYVDILVSSSGFPLTIYPGNENGNFSTYNNITEYGTLDTPIQIADLNNDNHIDVIYFSGNNLISLINTGNGITFTSITKKLPLGFMGQPFITTHLNDDAYIDIAIPCFIPEILTLIGFGDGNGSFTLDPIAYENGMGIISIASNYLNDDANMDLVLANSESNNLTLLYNTGKTFITKDVGVVSILSPPDSINLGEIIIPSVIVNNFGSQNEDFEINFTINNYSENQTISLEAGLSNTVVFPNWTPESAGTFQVTATTTLSGDENSSNDILSLTTIVHDTTSEGSFNITSITPAKGGLGGVVSVVISGNGFQDGAEIKLSKDGEEDIVIPSFFTTVNSETEMEALFNLRDTEISLGSWDIIITNPNNSKGIFNGGFTVEDLNEDMWINIAGRDPIQVGEETPITIWFGNNGNVDARDIIIELDISDQPMFKFDLEIAPDYFITILDYKIRLYHGILAPGEQSHFTMNLLFPIETGGLGGEFDFEARVSVFDPQEELFWGDHFYYNDGEVVTTFEGKALAKTSFGAGCGAMSTVSSFLKSFVQDEISGYEYENLVNTMGSTVKSKVTGELTKQFEGEAWELVEDEFGRNIKVYYDAYGQVICAETVANNYLDCMKLIWGYANSQDPNDKTGPSGAGDGNWVTAEKNFPYTIFFENVDSATSAAHKIVVKDTLDPDLDWSTLTFLDYKHEPTSVTFDSVTGEIVWTFDGIELPPNINPPEGESHFNYYIKAKENLPSGTQITNQAAIFFDYNYPIFTSTVLNTIDSEPPVSSINSIPDETDQLGIQLTWTGQDEQNGSGIDHYLLYGSENNSPFRKLGNYKTTNTVIIGKDGSNYKFYIEAIDLAGNKENKLPQAEVSTIVKAKSKIAVSPSPFVPNRGHEKITFFGGDIANSTYIWVLNSPTCGEASGKFAIIR